VVLSCGVRPTIELHETDREYIVSVDCPGVAKEDLRVSQTDNQLSVQCNKRFPYGKENFEMSEYHLRSYGLWSRTLSMPQVTPSRPFCRTLCSAFLLALICYVRLCVVAVSAGRQSAVAAGQIPRRRTVYQSAEDRSSSSVAVAATHPPAASSQTMNLFHLTLVGLFLPFCV
jgi:hypothetical protein